MFRLLKDFKYSMVYSEKQIDPLQAFGIPDLSF